MAVERNQRIIYFDQQQLDDPDPALSIEEVLEYYAEIYPILTQAAIEGPELRDEGMVYTFRKAVGTKGQRISVARIAKGNIPFPFEPVRGQIDFSLMEQVARTLKYSSGDSILPPSDSIGLI